MNEKSVERKKERRKENPTECGAWNTRNLS